MSELEAFRQALQKQILFWQSNHDDPHGIGNAVLGSLYAVEQALTDAILNPPTPPVEHEKEDVK